MRRVSRRGFLGGAAAVGATGLIGAPRAGAYGDDGGGHDNVHHDRLPRRGEFTIRRAHVMSMDREIGDVAGGDVHVRHGEIVAVGRGLRSRGRTIDGRRTIVMPGLIDTHWHMWTTLYRSLASSSPANAYFALNVRHGRIWEPGDTEIGVRLAAADALTNGITAVHDWSHNIRGPEYADANLRALARSGLRGRFSYGTPQGHPADLPIDLDDLRRVAREWFASGRAELLHLGLAGRPPAGTGAAELERHRLEYRTARELGLPVSFHANSNRAQGERAMIAQLGEEGMLGPHTQVIHALYTTAAERSALVSSETSVSLSPWSELLIGYGVTTVRELFEAGALVNLSVDTLPLTGTSDMFSIIRLALGLHRGQSESEFSISARRMIAAATIDAARGLGIDDATGSLTPGKRADLIMVRTDDVNIAPFTDAPNMIATAAQPSNVDTVVVDGRILKRHGRLTAVDTRRVVAEASAALAAVLARAGTPAAASVAREAAGDVACCG
jgi:cytosine/adenosine deaminase-related metal-dependent hydrolase